MKLNDIADAISKDANVSPKTVRTIATETLKVVRSEIESNEKTGVPGLGIFIKKKIAGEERILYRPPHKD